jgi:hypothetical protein
VIWRDNSGQLPQLYLPVPRYRLREGVFETKTRAVIPTYYANELYLIERWYLLHATKRNRLWFDQGCKRGRIYLHSLLGQAIEQFVARGRRTTVESKGELVEIIIQVMVSDRTLMGAEQPSLQQRDHVTRVGAESVILENAGGIKLLKLPLERFAVTAKNFWNWVAADLLCCLTSRADLVSKCLVSIIQNTAAKWRAKCVRAMESPLK